MKQQTLSIRSEIKELEDILAQIPPENIIERMSIEARLEAVRKELEAEAQAPVMPTKARLVFRGKPVRGTHGIFADFASKASTAFIDAYSAVVAGLCNNLRYMGPIPDRATNDLLITGVAAGSFGFEFELPSRESELFLKDYGEDKTELAFEKIQALFKTATHGSDDEIVDLVDEIHPRAVKKVEEFLNYLAGQKAYCGLEINNNWFRYDDIEQINRSIERLKESNIKETKETYEGEFQGILPKGRTFEFKLKDGAIIRGKIDRSIDDPDLINKAYLHKTATVTFEVIQVGQSRPKFTLLSIGDIKINMQYQPHRGWTRWLISI